MSVPTEGAPGGAPAGGAEGTPPAPATQQQPAPTPMATPGGEAALQAERDGRQRAEAEVARLNQEKEAQRIAGLDEASRKIEEARIEGKTQAETEFKARELTWRVRSAAAEFHDTELVAGLVAGLNPESTDAEIQAALHKVGTEKPYLLKSGTPPPPIGQGPQTATATTDATTAADGESFVRDMFKRRQGTLQA